MKKIFTILCFSFLMGFAAIGCAEVKIGVLDLNKILMNAPQVNAMRDTIKNQFDPQGKEITRMRDTLKQDVDKYNKTNASLSTAQRKEVQLKILRENKQLQDKQLSFQQNLITAQNNLMRPFLQKISDITTAIAHKQNFNLIVIKTSTAYNDANLEITDQVLAEIQKK
jgi:outer membrane protein